MPLQTLNELVNEYFDRVIERLIMGRPVLCCKVGCNAPATIQVYDRSQGAGAEDTYCCAQHLGEFHGDWNAAVATVHSYAPADEPDAPIVRGPAMDSL